MRKHIFLTIAASMLWGGLKADVPRDSVPEPMNRRLDAVEVQAQTGSRTLRSSSPMSRMDAVRMKVTGVADLSDALHRMPGITLRDYGGAGGLKTVSVRGFGAGHTAVVYDGIALSDGRSGQIDVSRYSLDNLGQMSMVVGDNDDIFIPARQAASAATLRLTSVAMTSGDRLTAQMRFGSFGYYNPFLRIDKAIGEKVVLSANGEFMHSDNDYPFTVKNGVATTRERRNNSRMQSGHGELNLQWEPTSRRRLSAKLYYYDSSRRLPGAVVYYNNENYERLDENNMFAQLNYRSVLDRKWSVQLSGKFNRSVSLYSDRSGRYPGGELHQNYWQREAYLSGCVLFMPVSSWALDYSADYIYNNMNSNLPTDIRPVRNAVLQTVAARWRSDRLTVMARGLYSLYLNSAGRGEAARNASRLSPSVSVSVQPWRSELLFARVSYKNIFRMPSFSEAYFDHRGSADLRPENTDQINVGLTYSPRPSGRLAGATFTADAYMNHIDDMIVAVPYNLFLWSMTNMSRVRTFGLDLTADATLSMAHTHSLLLVGTYSLQRAQPRTSPESSEWMKQVAYIPRHSGSVSLSYENPWANLALHLTGASERYTTNNNIPSTRMPGYAEFGATLYRTFRINRRHELELRADLRNILNTQYEIVARYPMPGRSWMLTVKYSFINNKQTK